MWGFLDSLIQYINQDVTNNNESKNLAVVLRYISLFGCFMFGIYFLIFLNLGMDIFMIDILLVFLFAINFHLTYINYTKVSLWLTILGKLLFIISHISYLGWNLGFQYFSIEIFILLYYGYYNRIAFKMVFTSLVLFMCSFLYFKFRWGYIYKVFPEYLNTFCDMLNLFSIIIVMAITVLYFSTKSNEAEMKLIQYNKKLEYLVSIDPLTELYNRRSMMGYLEKRSVDYMVEQKNFALTIGDIDFFKHVNDKYGHECGDFVLVQLSKIIKGFIEGKGLAARWGGEEFLLVFEKTNIDEATILLNDLLILIRNYKFKYNNNELNITMTFGVAEFDPYTGIDYTIHDADDKLYLGKKTGRNKIVF